MPEMAEFLDEAIGGHFQVDWSVNPIWKMNDPLIAKHPVTRGVKPFEVEEEFYYHIRFREGVTPLLRALPPASSLGADGPRSGNPEMRKELADQVPQTLAWAVENPNKSRGFGFTGGHFHSHWANENFRQLVLNAIVWTAGAEVPEGGVIGKVAATPAYQTIDEAIAKGDLDDVKLHLAANPQSANTRRPGQTRARRSNRRSCATRPEIALLLLEAGADPNTTNASQAHAAAPRRGPQQPGHRRRPAQGRRQTQTRATRTAGRRCTTPPPRTSSKPPRPCSPAAPNPMTLSKLGGTPLHEAAASGGAEIIRLLLDHKVDPAMKSKEGVTALDIAKQYKNQPAIDALSN